jgi:hypothetical protein
MKQKTPLQQAIAELQKKRADLQRQINNARFSLEDIGRAGKIVGLEHSISILSELLPTEQEQIEDAWEDGLMSDGFRNGGAYYFTSKFEQ